jgi:hypothetical protein
MGPAGKVFSQARIHLRNRSTVRDFPTIPRIPLMLIFKSSINNDILSALKNDSGPNRTFATVPVWYERCEHSRITEPCDRIGSAAFGWVAKFPKVLYAYREGA